MKKMIITIIILAIIFIGMVINRQIEQANEIKIEEIQLVENYMEKIYGWSEITNQALPEFDNLNEANTKWLWGIVRKNIEEEEITYETINEKVKELINSIINIFILVSFYIMIAGFGAYLEQEINLNSFIGSSILAVMCCILLKTNINGIVKINEILIPILIIVVLIIRNSKF